MPSQDQHQINARKLHFFLGSNDVGDAELGGGIDAFALRRDIDNVLLTADGNLILDSVKTIKLHSGARTLQTALELKDLPTRVTTFTPLPSSFLAHYFADGYDEQRIVYSRGPRFEREAIETHLGDKRELARYRNDQQTAKPKQMLIKPVNIGNCDLELGDCYEASFTEWRRDPETSTYRVANPECEPYCISIESRKGNHDQKQKHYWIYSHRDNFGKSRFVKEFVTKYNAHRVGDTNSWVGVSESAQFLVFESFEGDHKLSWSSLKSLTGSTACGERANRKSYGHSYQPRDDVQVVILSNKSPFETYGIYDAKTTRRYISMDVLSQLEARFYVHRLDGQVEEDRDYCVHPSEWTDEQFTRQLCNIFQPLSGRNPTIDNAKKMMLGVLEHIDMARRLSHERYSVRNRSETVIDALAERLDVLPIHIPGLETSIGDMVRAIYDDANGKKKNGVSLERAISTLVDEENCARHRPIGFLLDEFLQLDHQSHLEKDAAYMLYIRKNRRLLYDGVFDATRRCSVDDYDDDENKIYCPEILAEMMTRFDDTFPSTLFSTEQIRIFLKLVLQEYFSVDQSRVNSMVDCIQQAARGWKRTSLCDDTGSNFDSKRPRIF